MVEFISPLTVKMSPPERPRELIDLGSRMRGPLQRGLYRIAGPLIENSLSIRAFNDIYRRAAQSYQASDFPTAYTWFHSCLESVGLRYEVQPRPGACIPTTGPLLVVANHPFGFADAVVLGDFLSSVRGEARMMANALLSQLPEAAPWMIAVDNFGGPGSERRNLAPMKEAIRFLRSGGALSMFPSGEVAHFQLGHGVEEAPWKSHLGSLVRRTGATVLPVYFPGQNSVLFQMAGMIHPRLRTALLLNELSKSNRQPLTLRVGAPIPAAKLRHFQSDEEITRYLRIQTLALRHGGATPPAAVTVTVVRKLEAEPDMMVAGEIARLRESGALLAEQGHLEVLVARAAEVPCALQEIGRLRELTFRAVGEGTGNDIDLDRFDGHYLHLILWDRTASCIAGAYRMGLAPEILATHGPKGLYTGTLFRYSRAFYKRLDHAIELGRSFIRQEYQRHPASLLLLWKGIASWVRRHPSYRILFGPVSISADYDEVSRRLMVDFLISQRRPAELACLARPRSPFRSRAAGPLRRELRRTPLSDVDDLSSLIATIESDQKGLPVLLKQYLRLNASILCFNVDGAFSSVLDGLIFVDLTRTEPRLLGKYMGEEGSRSYLDHHGLWPESPSSQYPFAKA